MATKVFTPADMDMARRGTHGLVSGGARVGFTSPTVVIGVTTKLKSFFRLAVEILLIEVSNRSDCDFVFRNHAAKLVEHSFDVDEEVINGVGRFDVEFKGHAIDLHSALVHLERIFLITLDEVVGTLENALLGNENLGVAANKKLSHDVFTFKC